METIFEKLHKKFQFLVKNIYSLCPKNIVRFQESWKMTNFEKPYLKKKLRDCLQILRRSIFWFKL